MSKSLYQQHHRDRQPKRGQTGEQEGALGSVREQEGAGGRGAQRVGDSEWLGPGERRRGTDVSERAACQGGGGGGGALGRSTTTNNTTWPPPQPPANPLTLAHPLGCATSKTHPPPSPPLPPPATHPRPPTLTHPLGCATFVSMSSFQASAPGDVNQSPSQEGIPSDYKHQSAHDKHGWCRVEHGHTARDGWGAGLRIF